MNKELLAVDIKDVFGQISPPPQIAPLVNGGGAFGLSLFFSNLVNLIFVVAGIIFVFMVLFSAFQFITSGGDKEAVSKARGRLTYAIIGIVLLSFAFLIMNTLGRLTGFKFF